MTPSLSVVIVTYNSARTIGECLRSVRRRAPAGSQVIVVDNGSADHTAALVTTRFPEVTLIRSTNRGFGAGVNQGMAQATGAYVLLLNPDAALLPRSVDHLIHHLDTHHECGVVGGRFIGHDHRPQPSWGRFPTASTEFFHAFGLHRIVPGGRYRQYRWFNRFGFERTGYAEWVSGGFCLLRRAAFVDVGGFDEGFFMYLEDVDLCRRLWQAGWTVWTLGSATARHEGQGSFGGDRPAVWRFEEQSLRYYFHKWHNDTVASRTALALQRLRRRFAARRHRHHH